ncbi:MAG: von Willebrand factor [Bacteroidetes bacterium ADurb.Bin408]|nr:MAG: von Willebrand factor [Bacteroidetes bacterium ADurb.Bin408]
MYDKAVGKRSCAKADSYYAPATVSAGYVGDYDGLFFDYNTESYDVINENNFKEVVNDPLSTFSIDVDRASYSNVRRFLTQNQKPPKDAVRIEELINYFDYDYPKPKNGDPFSVNIELAKCPWNTKNELVLIGLKGENVNEKEIPPSNLVFLIDVSGSMSDQNKLPLLKQSFKYLVNNLRSDDKVAIVVYAGAAGVVLESTPGTKKEKILASLENLQAGGSTAGGEGIKLAYKIAKQNFIANGNNRVILATDGDFNVGASSDAEMVRLIESKRDDGIYLTILGFGMGNYKDSKMEQLSNAGNGNYAYIDNILEAKKMFGSELWGTLYTIAKDVKIQVEFNPAIVKAYRLVGYENRILNKEDFNNDKKDAGDIGCGHAVTALYEIIPATSSEKVSNVDPLEYQRTQIVESKYAMTVKLRYKKPDEDVSNLIVQKYKPTAYSESNNIKFAAAVAQFGMLLRDSEFKGSANWANVIKMAKESKGIDEYGYRNDFIKMIEMAEMLADK